MDTLFLNALKCKNDSKRPPIWIMRQAGRYMPEYRNLRKRYSFLELCRNPELIAEVTKLPISAFGMDAAILFSDILLIADTFKVGLHFDDGIGPVIQFPIQNEMQVHHLPESDVQQELAFVASGIKLLKSQLKVPLIGFCGAPFTVASYMIEGKSSKDLKQTKKWLLKDPKSFHLLLEKITKKTIDYLRMQIDAGVNAIQIFDSWANILAYNQFCEFSKQYMQKIMIGIQDLKTPVILFCRGSSVFGNELASLSPSAIGLDWNCNIKNMRDNISKNVALQGNLDPDILYAPHSIIKRETKLLLKSMHAEKGYIFNLGHGIPPDVEVDAVKILMDCVKNEG